MFLLYPKSVTDIYNLGNRKRESKLRTNARKNIGLRAKANDMENRGNWENQEHLYLVVYK